MGGFHQWGGELAVLQELLRGEIEPAFVVVGQFGGGYGKGESGVECNHYTEGQEAGAAVSQPLGNGVVEFVVDPRVQ